LGGPAKETFVWQYEDKSGKVHTTEEVTPLQFAEQFVPFNVDDKVVIMNAPGSRVPYGHLCAHNERGNVVERPAGKCLNLHIDEIKSYLIRSLRGREESICFTCDVRKDSEFGTKEMDDSLRHKGVLDPALFNFQRVLGTTTHLNKRERIEFHDTVANHLMLISGVDIRKTKKGEEYVVKWRVENSWGKKRCHQGYFHMSDKWLEENTFHFVVDKSLLSEEHQRIFEDGEVTLLPKWWLMEKNS
jgi:bleomycin hydrolase